MGRKTCINVTLGTILDDDGIRYGLGCGERPASRR